MFEFENLTETQKIDHSIETGTESEISTTLFKHNTKKLWSLRTFSKNINDLNFFDEIKIVLDFEKIILISPVVNNVSALVFANFNLFVENVQIICKEKEILNLDQKQIAILGKLKGEYKDNVEVFQENISEKYTKVIKIFLPIKESFHKLDHPCKCVVKTKKNLNVIFNHNVDYGKVDISIRFFGHKVQNNVDLYVKSKNLYHDYSNIVRIKGNEIKEDYYVEGFVLLSENCDSITLGNGKHYYFKEENSALFKKCKKIYYWNFGGVNLNGYKFETNCDNDEIFLLIKKRFRH